MQGRARKVAFRKWKANFTDDLPRNRIPAAIHLWMRMGLTPPERWVSCPTLGDLRRHAKQSLKGKHMWPFGKPEKLVCGGCRQAYVIGVDSVRVTADDVFEAFAGVIGGGGLAAEPDLVDLTDQRPPPRSKGRGGEAWRCHKCDHINRY